METTWITYCSAEKNMDSTLCSAIDRYKSQRIKSIYNSATIAGDSFMILSGHFGLLDPDEKIPFYDHLLLQNEVEKHAKKVAEQLKANAITKVRFYSASVEADPNIKPYLDCITIACQTASVELTIIYTSLPD